MRYLLRTCSSDSDYNADCDYAVIDITKELAAEILRRRKAFTKMKEEDSALWEMYFWGGTQECISGSSLFFTEIDPPPLSKDQETLLEDNGFLELPEDFKVEADDILRTECEQMVIREDGVCWYCIPKHADVNITTESLKYGLIEACL